MKYFKKADNALDVEVNKLSTIGNQSLIVKNTGGENDNDIFISNSGARKAKFRSTADNSLGVSTLAPFSVFKVDGGENLVPEPKIVDVSFATDYNTLQIEGGFVYGSEAKANLIDIHKIIIESEQEIQLTDYIALYGIYGRYGNAEFGYLGQIQEEIQLIDFISPNKIDITKLFIELSSGMNMIKPDVLCFYLSTSNNDNDIYEITQTFTGRTKLGDPITVDVNDENVTIDYDQLLSEAYAENVSISDNIAAFTDIYKECAIIYDGEITDTLLLGAYIKPINTIGIFDSINVLISDGVITYNDNIITIPEGAFADESTEGFYCLLNVNFSDDGTTPTSINLVPSSYIVQETVINENPYYFETEGEHEVEFEYVNKFYPHLAYPRTHDYFLNSCIIEFNDNFYDYYGNDSISYIGTESIEKITLSNNVPEYIVERHISDLKWYSNLKEININTDKYISINNCVINKTNWSLVGYYGTDIVVPGLVKSIGSIFYSNRDLKTVVLPNGITSIENYAFRYCSSLTSVTIGTGVTSIGKYAFQQCSNLTSINIPDSVTSIGNNAFEDCSNLTSINIPNSVTSIKHYTFDRCSNLTSVNIGTGVTSIGDYAFDSCSSLASITIPNSVTSIGQNAFYNCSNLTSVNIPDSVTSIGKFAFSGCSNLTSITIPNSVTSIGNSAFSGCSSLTSVNIPDSVTSIRQYTFSGCSNLTSVTIGTGVTSIENYAFSECTGLTKINIENIESFCKISFGNYTSALPLYFGKNLYINDQLVTDLNIPDTITTLPGGIFYNCESIQKVTLPSTLTNIGSSTFRSCINLSEITCNAMTAPTISASTFRDVKTGGVLKVPTGATGYDAWLSSSDYYLGKYGWSIEYI